MSSGSSRYEAAVATLIGFVAVLVSGYTAYVQRQQVRAQVWPVLEFGTGNVPEMHVTLANKGVGPALIKHVLITVDDRPVTTWHDALLAMLGPGDYGMIEDDIGTRVMSAGESKTIFSPRSNQQPLHPGPPDTLGGRFDEARHRLGAEICYCSTLGECWTLISRPRQLDRVEEVRSCPARSAQSFQQ